MSILALPEPSWHTCISATPHLDVPAWVAFVEKLRQLSDPELIELDRAHDAFDDFNRGMFRYLSWGCHYGRFTPDEWRARRAASEEVRDAIRRAMIQRFRAVTEAKLAAIERAKAARQRKRECARRSA